MAAQGNKTGIGNKGNTTNHTGGRLKAGEVGKLLDLWNGEVKLKDIKVIKTIETVEREVYNEKYKSHRKTKEKVEKISFLSGYDAFCYKVLNGHDGMLKALLDKLHADQKNITVEEEFNESDLTKYGDKDLEKRKHQIEEQLAGNRKGADNT